MLKRVLLSTASVRPYVVITNQTEDGQAANVAVVRWLVEFGRKLEMARAVYSERI